MHAQIFKLATVHRSANPILQNKKNYFLPSIIYHHGRGNLAGGRKTSATAALLVWLPYILLQ
jgi:hypothetical protein